MNMLVTSSSKHIKFFSEIANLGLYYGHDVSSPVAIWASIIIDNIILTR